MKGASATSSDHSWRHPRNNWVRGFEGALVKICGGGWKDLAIADRQLWMGQRPAFVAEAARIWVWTTFGRARTVRRTLSVTSHMLFASCVCKLLLVFANSCTAVLYFIEFELTFFCEFFLNPRPWFSMSGQDLVADLSDGVFWPRFLNLELLL